MYRRGISERKKKDASGKASSGEKVKGGAKKLIGKERAAQLEQVSEAVRFMNLNNLTKASAAICNKTLGEDVGLDDVTGAGIPIIPGKDAAYCGQKRTVKRWPLINVELLQRAYDRGEGRLMGVSHYILTKSEEEHLKQEIITGIKKKEPLNRKKQRLIIYNMLKLRARQTNKNSSGSFRKSAIPLSDVAKACLKSNATGPSNKFFRSFTARHGLSDVKLQRDDADRLANATEEEVVAHLAGVGEECMTLPKAHELKISHADAGAFLRGLKLEQKDVIAEAPDDEIFKPVVPAAGLEKLKSEHDLDLTGLDRPVWMVMIEGLALHSTDGIDTVISEIENKMDTEDELLVVLNSACPYETAVFNPLLPSLNGSGLHGRFTSGDVRPEVGLLAQIKKIEDEITELETRLQATDFGQDKEGKAIVEKGLLALKAKLARAYEEDQLRGLHRFGNGDEMPQLCDYQGEKGTTRETVTTLPGVPAVSAYKPNRELISVTPLGLLAGRIEFCQLILSTKTFGETSVGSNLQSNSSLLLSLTENGQQTHESLLGFFRAAQQIVFEKVRPCVEFGDWKICDGGPVVLALDGHASRRNEDVLNFMAQPNPAYPHFSLRPFIEKGKMSDTVQTFDQIFRTLHHWYQKHVAEVRTSKADPFKPRDVYKLTRYDAIQIFAMLHPPGGALWVMPSALIAAFRHVGVTTRGFNIEDVPAKNLTQQSPLAALADAETQSPAFAAPSPPAADPTVRAGSAATSNARAVHWEQQAKQQHQLLLELEEKYKNEAISLGQILKFDQPIDLSWRKEPEAGGKLSVSPSDQTGSLLAGSVASRLAKKKSDDVSGSVAAAKTKLDLAAWWQQCSRACACGQEPCRIAGLQRCDFCGKIQKRICGKGDCKAKRAELTARSEVLPADLGEPPSDAPAAVAPQAAAAPQARS